MGLQFHETVRGARFFDHQVPTLIKAIERLTAAIEENSKLQQENLYAIQSATSTKGAAPTKITETYFCYVAYNTETYAYTTFCRSAREAIVWANTQIESAVIEGFELVKPFTAEREFFGAIADAKSGRIELKHPDGRTRYIGFERE